MIRSVLLLVLLLTAPSLALAQVDAVPPLPVPPGGLAAPAVDQEGVETLTRGPIHEAYANPAEPDPEPSPVVPQKPPADIPEQPPEYEPEGGDFDWISGYWDWDDDRDAYGVAEAKQELLKAYAFLDQRLAGRAWAAGERFTLADCAAVPALFYGDMRQPIPGEHANLNAYRRRLEARPAAARVIAEAEPFMHMVPREHAAEPA